MPRLPILSPRRGTHGLAGKGREDRKRPRLSAWRAVLRRCYRRQTSRARGVVLRGAAAKDAAGRRPLRLLGRRGSEVSCSALEEHDFFGKSVFTPDQVRGRLFLDRALSCGRLFAISLEPGIDQGHLRVDRRVAQAPLPGNELHELVSAFDERRTVL